MKWLSRIVDSFEERVVYRTSSPFNTTLEVVQSGNKLILDAKSVNYSYGGLHRSFQQLFRRIKIKSWNVRDILILGFGAGSVASILQNEYKIDCKITGVEIDPEVIKIGKEFFNSDSFRNLELKEMDAFQFLLNNTKTYDLVVVDLYIDKDVPLQAETGEFANLVKRALEPNGHLIFNKWVYDIISQESAFRLEEILRNTFDNLTKYTAGHDRMNRMLVCRRID